MVQRRLWAAVITTSTFLGLAAAAWAYPPPHLPATTGPINPRSWSCPWTAALLALTAVAAAAWLLARWRCRRALRRLLADVRDRRYARRTAPLTVCQPGDLAGLAREFNVLFSAWRELGDDLESSRRQLHSRLVRSDRQWRAAVNRLRQSALTDSLSGLANRKLLDSLLHDYFQTARRAHTDLACLMIDLDEFKTVNDRLGHAAGDNLIAFAGELLAASVRAGDLAARYGGDEFVLLLPDCDRDRAALIAERFRLLFARESARLLRDSAPDASPDAALPRCRLSIGIATLHASQPASAPHLIQLADAALYRVKRSGRNAVAVA